nr:CAAX amino terminal protease [Tanacetum cinerariifolium]
MVVGVFPINISHLLGGSVSLDEGFCRDLALKRVFNTISLMEAIHKLNDPQWKALMKTGIESHGYSFQHALDVFNTTCNGDHAVHFYGELGVRFRHILVPDILVDICSKVGIMVYREAPMGFLLKDEKDLRPTDLLLFNWIPSKDACLDVTGISPFDGMG